jgi:hypothetical protein
MRYLILILALTACAPEPLTPEQQLDVTMRIDMGRRFKEYVGREVNIGLGMKGIVEGWDSYRSIASVRFLRQRPLPANGGVNVSVSTASSVIGADATNTGSGPTFEYLYLTLDALDKLNAQPEKQ